MKFIELFKTSLQSLKANPKRSFLTMLGIIIGIAAVITIMSLGDGVKKRMYDLFSTNATGVQKTEIDFIATGKDQGEITSEDINKIESNFAGQFKSVKLKREDKQLNFVGTLGGEEINGTLSLLKSPDDPDIVAGKNISRFQLGIGDEVALISKALAKKSFKKSENALGSSIVIDNQSYTIVGVFNPSETWDSDGRSNRLGADVLVPSGVYLKGKKGGTILEVTFVKDAKASKISKKIAKYLKKHGKDRKQGDYVYYDTGAALKKIGSVIETMTYFVSAIAAISLFIAGIGVMNMMYISVSERTQEIGIRLAVGARPSDILIQFLLEAVMLTVTGGLLGFALGWLIGAGISPFLPQKIHAVVTMHSFLLAFGVSSAVGVVFGILPAKQAANKNLIDILR